MNHLRSIIRSLRVSGWLGGIGLLLTTANASQFFSDPINYPNGNLGSVGSDGGWQNSNAGVTVVGGSLDGSALGLTTSSGSKIVTTTASASGTYNQFSAGITSGSVYCSFLLRVNSTSGLDSTGKVIAGLIRSGSASSYYVDAWLRLANGNVQIGLSKLRAGTAWHDVPLAVGMTYLVVLKYEFIANSNNDGVALWLNPVLDAIEPAAVVAFTTGSDGNSGTGIGRCYVYGGMAVDVDEIRIASTWAEATPNSGITPQSTVPIITETLLTTEGLRFRGTNGVANGAFDLLASVSLAPPVEQWGEIASDNFDASGHFELTLPLPVGVAQQFYRLRIGSGAPPLVAPQFTIQPTNLTVLADQSATFYSAASGTAPLSYQWYFSDAALSGANAAMLTINNAQTNHAGDYFVIVTNFAGVVTSQVATLAVSNLLAPPSFVTLPQSQTVTEGQTAVLSVVAAGTLPLSYQWFFADNPLTDQTNATLSIAGVTANEAGNYYVSVTNLFGATNSPVATMVVNLPSDLDFSHVGFAANGMSITGGAAGPTVYVGSSAELEAYSDVNPPYTIYITNSFALSGMSTHLRNNKTVIGLGNIVLTGGGLYLYRSTNVIIRNLTIQNSSEDGVGVHYSANVWIDHCTIKDAADGGIDLTQQSDNVTISWCRFTYTSAVSGNHNFVSLIASSDADAGSYRTTYHHNWWDVNCAERMPSVRFGRAHVFNNYYNAPGNNYCVRTRKQAECRVENNFFANVKNPWEQYITSSGDTQGKLFATGNNVPFLGTAAGVIWSGTTTNKDGTIRVMIPGTDSVFVPSYSYPLHAAAEIPNIVTNNAGANAGPFAP